MDRRNLIDLLTAVADRSMDVDAAATRLAAWPGVDLGFAHVDTHRAVRTGQPEAVFGEGKTADQIVAILRHIHDAGQDALATRVDGGKASRILEALPEAEWHAMPRLVTLRRVAEGATAVDDRRGTICVVAAGTSDLPVAEEAAVVAELYGNPVDRINDVGVAGIHRLLMRSEQVRQASVVIVVAGMEGALASVVAGLVDRPVIAVPTSVGYGASFGGLAALLGMLNSCAAGVSVVNIDNGYGAAVQADLINRTTGGSQR